jgi:hypothetical protein
MRRWIIWTSGPDTKHHFVNKYGLVLMAGALEELTGDGW